MRFQSKVLYTILVCICIYILNISYKSKKKKALYFLSSDSAIVNVQNNGSSDIHIKSPENITIFTDRPYQYASTIKPEMLVRVIQEMAKKTPNATLSSSNGHYIINITDAIYKSDTLSLAVRPLRHNKSALRFPNSNTRMSNINITIDDFATGFFDVMGRAGLGNVFGGGASNKGLAQTNACMGIMAAGGTEKDCDRELT